jgi:hypothetical protein
MWIGLSGEVTGSGVFSLIFVNFCLTVEIIE